jgi:thiamine biosynthesis lipoprotein
MFHRREFRAMGTMMLAILDAPKQASVLEDVPLWFEEWEQSLSRFRIDSELSQLNANPGVPRTVSQTLWDVYAAALDAEQLTGGLVNALLLKPMIQAGYDRSFDDMRLAESDTDRRRRHAQWLQDDPMIEAPPPLSSVASDRFKRTLCIPDGAGLDFGGTAKGWAANRAMQRLQRAGPSLVSAGGDIAISGPRSDGSAWPIDVDDPFREGAFIETLYVERGGVATSGKDHRHWMSHGIGQHHVIDPRTGVPARTDILTATVIAGTSMQAEALAKAVMISGSPAGLEWIDRDDSLAGILVLENGRKLYSRNIEKYL